MDIVLNGFCKQSASYRKCLGKSSTYKRTSANGVVHRKKFSNFARGGRGVGRSVKVVGASATPKKRKWKKVPMPHYPLRKKGVGGFHKAGFGRNPTTKETQRS
jgi:hypothetical protein